MKKQDPNRVTFGGFFVLFIVSSKDSLDFWYQISIYIYINSLSSWVGVSVGGGSAERFLWRNRPQAFSMVEPATENAPTGYHSLGVTLLSFQLEFLDVGL
jgi:hypothetical protein